MSGKSMMVIFVTANGNVRKNSLRRFFAILMRSGKIAMKFEEDDKIVGVKICRDESRYTC